MPRDQYTEAFETRMAALERIAGHEAAHAAAFTVCGIAVSRILVDPISLCGSCSIEPRSATTSDPADYLRALLAGSAHDWLRYDRKPDPHSKDWCYARAVAAVAFPDADAALALAFERATRFVEQYAAEIETLANVLMLSGELKPTATRAMPVRPAMIEVAPGRKVASARVDGDCVMARIDGYVR